MSRRCAGAFMLAWGLMASSETGEAGQAELSAPTRAESALPLGPRVANGKLARERAEYRAARVSDLRYALDITLDPALDHFAGTVEIAFALTGANADLTVDFDGGTIADLRVNGATVSDAYNGQFVTLPAVHLVEGPNVVSMSYTRPWTNDGTGLYRYDDPTDGRVYVYTLLEPWEARLLLPCFDQPDLKGRFQLTVHAPEDWTVITATRESSIRPGPEGAKTWTFPRTPLMSTFVLSLHAGPWATWEDPDFRYPLRVFCRQALAEHMDPDVWFSLTRRTFDVLEPYYGVEYPYEKYDQVVVPDFNTGGMENIAAVTFNENHIQRDGRDRDEELRLASLIAHEMAHMWFGNLVTMRWWDGLWLKESVAAYMGVFVAESIGYEEAWEWFFRGKKQGAYRTDRRVTTHAIQTPVESTEDVYDNWDAISYDKGAAVLRQATFLLGEEVFRNGLRLYLSRHAEGNTTLEDFVGALSEAAGQDLSGWAREWLFEAGVNTIRADLSCTEGRVDGLTLVQSAPSDHPVLRTQRVQIGFYSDSDGVVTTNAVLPVTYSGARTEVPDAVGQPCPTLVYPNHGDYGYAIVDLDERTRAKLARSLGSIEDSFQRLMLWTTLLDGARRGSIPIPEFLEAVLVSAAEEDDRIVMRQTYGGARELLADLLSMGKPGANALEAYATRLEELVWRRLLEARPEERDLLLDLYPYVAVFTEPGYRRLVARLDGQLRVPGLTFEQDRRWPMLLSLAWAGRGGALGRAKAELERDGSASARRHMVRLEAELPDLKKKSQHLDDLFDPQSQTSLADQRAAAQVLFPPGQEGIREQLADRVVAELASIEADPERMPVHKAEMLARYLTPRTCTEASVKRLARMVEDHKNSREPVLRAITERWEDDVRCVARARALSVTGP